MIEKLAQDDIYVDFFSFRLFYRMGKLHPKPAYIDLTEMNA